MKPGVRVTKACFSQPTTYLTYFDMFFPNVEAQLDPHSATIGRSLSKVQKHIKYGKYPYNGCEVPTVHTNTHNRQYDLPERWPYAFGFIYWCRIGFFIFKSYLSTVNMRSWCRIPGPHNVAQYCYIAIVYDLLRTVTATSIY